MAEINIKDVMEEDKILFKIMCARLNVSQKEAFNQLVNKWAEDEKLV